VGRRVVITSIGIVSSLGNTEAEIMDSLRGGKVCFKQSRFDETIPICPVEDFNLKAFTGRLKNARYLNRGAGFAVASAALALKDEKEKQETFSRTGLFAGTGPNVDIGGECPEIHSGKIRSERLQALWMLRFLPNTAASVISERFGIHGENATITTACSASLQALGEAFRKIKDGYLDTALAGGGDSRLSAGGLLAYQKAQALYHGKTEPEKAYAPFDLSRCGFVPGEGGAFFLLETLSRAEKRNAPIYGEVCGYGCTLDGCNMTAPDPEGEYGEKAVRRALSEAELPPEKIDLICSHGTGTPLNDEMEADLIHRIFQGSRPQVIALKSWIGHLAAACGAVETAITLFCMRGRYIPAIRNLKKPCHAGINLVAGSMEAETASAMIQSFGFGGQNAALVIRKWKNGQT